MSSTKAAPQSVKTPLGSLFSAATVAAENPSARVYNWVLAPGATSAMHTHVRPYLIIAAKGFTLKMTAPDDQSVTHEIKLGDFPLGRHQGHPHPQQRRQRRWPNRVD